MAFCPWPPPKGVLRAPGHYLQAGAGRARTLLRPSRVTGNDSAARRDQRRDSLFCWPPLGLLQANQLCSSFRGTQKAPFIPQQSYWGRDVRAQVP